jgi:hypothetical protein
VREHVAWALGRKAGAERGLGGLISTSPAPT